MVVSPGAGLCDRFAINQPNENAAPSARLTVSQCPRHSLCKSTLRGSRLFQQHLCSRLGRLSPGIVQALGCQPLVGLTRPPVSGVPFADQRTLHRLAPHGLRRACAWQPTGAFARPTRGTRHSTTESRCCVTIVIGPCNALTRRPRPRRNGCLLGEYTRACPNALAGILARQHSRAL